MRLRFRPTDNEFYELLSESASNLVAGATLLPEILPSGADKKDVAASDA